MKQIPLIITLLLPSVALSGELHLLEDKSLYQNPLAAPRTPKLGLSVNTSRFMKVRVAYIDAEIGRSIGLVGWSNDDVKAQIGLEGGAWMTLIYRKFMRFPLLTEDYMFSIPFAIQIKDLTFAIKYNHISAHLGDGMNKIVENKLSKEEKRRLEIKKKISQENGGYFVVVTPKTYSRDYISTHFGFSTETTVKMGFIDPYSALDVAYNQDTDSVDLSTESGIEVDSAPEGLSMRIGFTWFKGKDRRGQLMGHKLDKLGIKFSLQ
jgi:hypothetical protein